MGSSRAAAPDEATIGGVVEQLKTASAELAGYEAQIARLEKELAQLRGERDELEKQLAKRRRKIVAEKIRVEEQARLDGKDRDHLVERYFPHASHQVIVLSTDTEIDRRYFDQLQPRIARAYHLDYDDQKKVTVAEEGYFWGNGK